MRNLLATGFCLFTPLSAIADEIKLELDGDRFTIKAGSRTVKGFYAKPEGSGPFPAILVSHGLGSNGTQFGKSKAAEFVKWGYVCISPDYAHSGRDGKRKDFGASAENIARAKACLDALEFRAEVDKKKLCAYGNSMGAFLTVGLAAEEPRLVAAAITAGGCNEISGFPAPSQEVAAKIKTPMLILHGTADTTVPVERAKLLESTLKTAKCPNECHYYEGVGHDVQTKQMKDVNSKIEVWFKKHAKVK